MAGHLVMCVFSYVAGCVVTTGVVGCLAGCLFGTYVVGVHAWLLACKQVPNPGRHHRDGPKGRITELLTRRIMRTILKQALRQIMVSVCTDPPQVCERQDDLMSEAR